MQIAISLDGVAKRFGTNGTPLDVLKNFSLKIDAGSVVSILGRSGTGKTTILNLIAGLSAADHGAIEVVRAARPVRLLTQRDQLLPWLTVVENLRLGCELSDARVDAPLLNDLLRELTLKGFAHYYPSQLSGGMQRKVSLGRVLLTRPSTILLDEPFSNLDAPQRLAVAEALLRRASASRSTVVIVTHDIDEAILFSDRVIVLSGVPASIALDEENPLKSGVTQEDFLRAREGAAFGAFYRRIAAMIGDGNGQ